MRLPTPDNPSPIRANPWVALAAALHRRCRDNDRPPCWGDRYADPHMVFSHWGDMAAALNSLVVDVPTRDALVAFLTEDDSEATTDD